ncbi:hypothetical protein [Hymenobacter sp. B81]|uniref:hypothetical protein n=1 Tax=Hymenobacter sp. B81 TaxID=3344878 RepID=UPI0037DD2676
MKRLALLGLLLSLLSLSARAQMLKEKDVPAAVRAAATAQNNGQKPASWLLDEQRGYYVAIAAAPALRQLIIGQDGKWQRTSEIVALEKFPAAVRQDLQTRFLSKGYEPSNPLLVHTRTAGSYYSLDLSSDEAELQVHYSAAGKLLRQENR